MKNNPKKTVLIVGAGPTGLVLALWLTKLGIAVRVIDKNKRAGDSSRALIIQARTLEFYNQIGIANEVIASGIKMEYFALLKDGCPVTTVNVGAIGLDLSPYSFVLSFPQDDHEKLLLGHLKKAGVLVERNKELISFEQTKKGVKAVIKAKGQEEQIECDYLCGCDGARSTTREQLGIKFLGGTYSQRFFVADVTSPTELISGLDVGISETDFCLACPVRSSKTIRLIGIVPSEQAHKEEITFKDVEVCVARNTHINVTEVNWFSSYHVHHRVAPQFRCERVFLLGDAAHIHSPVGGQGMNTGIGDAINLAWKLAAVLNGTCSEKILETYEVERMPFAKKLVSTTDKVFQMVTSSSFLGSVSRNFIFPRIFPLILKHQALRQYFFKFISQINIKYRQSPLSIKSEGRVQAGDRLPWVWYKKTDNFDTLNILAWQIHVYGKINKVLPGIVKNLDIPLFKFAWTEQAKNKGLIENAAYLIRPDGYISVIDSSKNADQIKKMLVFLN